MKVKQFYRYPPFRGISIFLNNAPYSHSVNSNFVSLHIQIMIVMNDNIPEIDAEIMGDVRLVRNKGTNKAVGFNLFTSYEKNCVIIIQFIF